MVYKVNVDFPDEIIAQINKVPSVRLESKEHASELVDNAIRVYLQLKQIAKDKSSLTVVDQDGKLYTINLG